MIEVNFNHMPYEDKQSLKKDIIAITEEYDLKKKDYTVSVEVTELFKESVENLQLKLQEMEGRIGEQASENAQLKVLKEDILWAAKNALKKALNQKHLLRQALSNLDGDTANEIRAMLKEVNVRIDY